jgi:hypothetical protein
MLSKEQFEALVKKSEGKVEVKPPAIFVKPDDDTHGTINTDDVSVEYFYNELEQRLYFSVIKRHSLAAYVAPDNICSTYVMEILSDIAATSVKKPTSNDGGGDKKSNAGGSGEEAKKEQTQSV